MKKCRKCGYEIEKNARKCIRCGYEFKVRHCRVCGCKLETDYEFDARLCNRCGKEAAKGDQKIKTQKRVDKSKVFKILKLAQILTLAFGAFLSFLVVIYKLHPAIQFWNYDIEIAFKSRDKIIENSVEVDPTKLERNLNAYKGQYIKVEGQISSIYRRMEWSEVYIDMTPTDSGPDDKDIMLVIVRTDYEYDGLLKNDIVVVYGIGMNWTTCTTSNGVQESRPKMYSVDYVIKH